MKATILTILFFLPFSVVSQSKFEFQRTSFSKDISFIQLDSATGVRSTVVEYPKFLVVIELPMYQDGANRATNLAEDVPKATRYLHYLKATYNKPVKYILSTHWHLHSLSGITPFFEAGAKLVAARTNWDYSTQNGLLTSEATKQFQKQVVSINRDTVLLSNTSNPIQVWFLDQEYTFKPTKDYLFFYFPKDKSLYASCMCAMNQVDFEKRPEFVYNDRVSDLDRAIQKRQAPVENLLKLSAEYDAATKSYRTPSFTQNYFTEFKQHGTPMHQVVKTYAEMDLPTLTSRRDSLLCNLVEKNVSPQIINAAVYDCLKQKRFDNAIAWAQLLNLYQSGQPNYLDTMGEAYYQAGNTAMAKYYSTVLKKMDEKNFGDALANWARNAR